MFRHDGDHGVDVDLGPLCVRVSGPYTPGVRGWVDWRVRRIPVLPPEVGRGVSPEAGTGRRGAWSRLAEEGVSLSSSLSLQGRRPLPDPGPWGVGSLR